MNYVQKVLLGKLRELQDGRRNHNYFAATSEEKHWNNEFALIKAIRILSVSSHETPKVITNELTKEVGCINCIRHYSPGSNDCNDCDKNYSNFNQLVGSAPSKGHL